MIWFGIENVELGLVIVYCFLTSCSHIDDFQTSEIVRPFAQHAQNVMLNVGGE